MRMTEHAGERHDVTAGLRTTAQVVGHTLAELGVAHAFAVLGSGNLVATNAMAAAGVPVTRARHEGGAVCMASAYGRVNGGLAVCSVHQGPGLTNAMTGLADAAKTRTPLVVLAGDSSAGATDSTFYIDQDALARTAGAIGERVWSAATATADVHRAVGRSLDERLPVVLNVPLDVQAQPAQPGALTPQPRRFPTAPAEEAVSHLADLLTVAARPLILAGRGAVGAADALLDLGERTGALYATSALANGLFAGNPWSLGIAGGFSSPTTAALIGQADLILGMGVGFRDWTTRHGALIGDGATVVQVDADPTALGRHRPVDVAIVGDTAATATAVSGELARRGAPAGTWRTDALAAQIQEGQWRHQPYRDVSADGRLDPRTVAIRLNEVLPAERTVVVDGGDNTGYPILYWDVPDPSGFVFTSAGFQSIALGLSSAVGAAIARPDRLTVASVGDGGLLMAASELETVARLGLRLLVVVFNDAAYGAEVHHFRPAGEPVELVQFPETDAAAWAAALGIASCRVRTLDDLEPVGAWITDGTGPMLVDVRIDPDVVLDWAAEAFKGH